MPRLPPVTSTDRASVPPLARCPAANAAGSEHLRRSGTAAIWLVSRRGAPGRRRHPVPIDPGEALADAGLSAALARPARRHPCRRAGRTDPARGITIHDRSVEDVEFDADDTGLASGSSRDGTGVRAAVDLTPDAAALAGRGRRSRWPTESPRPSNTETSRAGRRARPRRTGHGCRPTRSTRSRSAQPDKAALLPSGADVLRHAASCHVDARSVPGEGGRYYADLAGTSTTQQRVRLRPDVTAIAVDRRRHGSRTDAHRRPAGRPGLGVPDRRRGWDWDAELAALPELLAEKLARAVGRGRPLRPRHRPDQPVADHPRVDRPRHRAGPRPGLRGGLRRHLVRHPRQARHACGTAPPVMHVTGDRTAEHGLATVGFDDEGVAGAVAWTWSRDGILVGYQLDRVIAARAGAAAAPTAARSPTPPRHMPIQRMANVSLQPAARRARRPTT